jgi:hypothetical protein
MNNASEMKLQNRDTDLNNLSVTERPTVSKEEEDAALEKFINRDSDVIPLLGSESRPVEVFDYNYLPETLIPWAKDIQNRLQCAPDFIGVGIMVGLASAVGNKLTIRPKVFDPTWSVVPNLWGLLIGNPSAMKTPALNAALEHVKGLDAIARDGKNRLVVHDSTIPQLQVLQSQTTTGLLMVNDEIASMFKKFDNPQYGGDRPYLLQAFNGDNSYSVDRVGRPAIYIPMNTLSLIGNIQPSVLKEQFSKNKNLNDGFMQRLQLAVYPDFKGGTKLVDAYPNEKAKDEAWNIYHGLYLMNHRELRFEAEIDSGGAQTKFYEWYEENAKLAQSYEADGRDDLASHLMKYPSMVASLALIIQLAEDPESMWVQSRALDKAVGWSKYLFSHAKRIYDFTDEVVMTAQTLIGKRHLLASDFSPSEVAQKGWSGLNKTQQVQEVVDYLVKHRYLFMERKEAGEKGGRPSVRYRWNNTLDD